MTGETEDAAHLETPRLSLKIISAQHQSLLQLRNGKEQSPQRQEFATIIKTNMKEKLLLKSKRGLLSELCKNV